MHECVSCVDTCVSVLVHVCVRVQGGGVVKIKSDCSSVTKVSIYHITLDDRMTGFCTQFFSLGNVFLYVRMYSISGVEHCVYILFLKKIKTAFL